MLSDVGCGQIKPARRTLFRSLKTESQGFVADTCRFLYGDLVRSPKEGDWRIYRDRGGLRTTHLKRKIKFSATIRQCAISKVTNSEFMAVHAVFSLEAADVPGKALCIAGGDSADGMKEVTPRIYRSRII